MVLLEIRDLILQYSTKRGIVNAVDKVSLSLEEGEVLGIAGESGCGKTTLALSLLRLLPSNARILSGDIIFDRRNLTTSTEDELRDVRWRDISIIFQNALNALNPVKKIGEQIAEPIQVHQDEVGNQVVSQVQHLLQIVGIDPSRINSYPHEFSGGMRQRVVIAMALACTPKLIIADEPVTALDVMVQAQIMELLKKLQREFHLSIILISHDLSIIAEVCDRVAIMYAGKIVEDGRSDMVFGKPLHPYTQGLLKAFPSIEESRTIESIPGSPPDLHNPPRGCRFHPRCPLVMNKCHKLEPQLLEVKKNHFAACFAI